MAVSAHVTEGMLQVEFSGQDRVWNMKTSLEVPVASISTAEAMSLPDVEARLVKIFGKRTSPTHASGYFHGPDGKEVWVVEGQDEVAVIDLREAKYGRLVLGVADPHALVSQVQDALTEARDGAAG